MSEDLKKEPEDQKSQLNDEELQEVAAGFGYDYICKKCGQRVISRFSSYHDKYCNSKEANG